MIRDIKTGKFLSEGKNWGSKKWCHLNYIKNKVHMGDISL